MHDSRDVPSSDAGKTRRFSPMALAGLMLLVGIGCGSSTPSGGHGAATWSVESQVPPYAIPVSEYPFCVSPFVKRASTTP